MRKKTVAAATAFAAAIMLAGCAPQLASTGSAEGDAQDQAPFVEATWSSESDCASCHEKEATSTDGCLYGLHAGQSCVDCHTDEKGLGRAHEDYTDPKARLPKKLKNTSIDPEACETCHDLTQITETSASCEVLTDDNGTVVNPHEIMVRESHVANSGSDLTCGSCHKMHEENGGDPAASAAEAASEKCLGCHHQNVYECGTCHE